MFATITALLPPKLRPYAKATVAVFGLVVTLVAVIVTDNQIVNVLIAAATALGVYGVPNVDSDGDGTPDVFDEDTYEFEDENELQLP